MGKIKNNWFLISLCLLCFQICLFSSDIKAQDDTIVIQEGETGMVSYDGVIDAKHAGFTGTGFIDTENAYGKGITWEICTPENGIYKLHWRYAHGKPDNRKAKVIVDGLVADTASFPPTGDFTVWDTTASIAVSLENGPHQIRLEAITSEGLANTDYISVTGNKPKAGFCPVLVTGVDVSPSVTTIGVKGLLQLSASVLPANATNQNISWASGDTTIARVNATGLVSGLKEGTVNIIVTTEDGSFTDTCKLTTVIVPVYYLETSVNGEGSIFPSSDSIAEGSKVCITATPSPGWIFDSLSGDTTSTDNPVCLTIDTNTAVTAYFSKIPYDYIIGFGKQPVDGYAGLNGTTGGGTTPPVIVTTAAQFRTAVGGSSPAVIIVEGMLDVGDVIIGANKTIAGSDINSGLYGGTIKIQSGNNIIQNLTIGPASADVMELSGATNVFITKCTFHDAGDEVLSIVRESDFVTVSWCKFYFDSPHDHAFGHLIGNSDSRTSDRGKLHVTMHHNWYAHGIRGRQPRVRYGHVHIYNNYYNSVGSGYCIGVGVECHIRVENTFFEGVSNPWADYGGVDNGEIGWNTLKFERSSQPTFVKNSFPAYDLPYAYVLDPVDSVKNFVLAGAGNVFKTYDTIKTFQASVTAPSDNDIFDENPDIVVEADASVSEGTIDSVQFFGNDELIGVATSAPYSVTWQDVPGGRYKITAKAIDNEGRSAFSNIVNITVAGGSALSEETISMNIFPNPATSEIIIQYGNGFTDEAVLTLYNSYGKTIVQELVRGNEYIMDIVNIPKGVYIMTLTSNKGTTVRQFIKE